MKLIIADDDEQIREGIKEGIDWKSLYIDEVFSAANGIEAFELFLRYTPDIIITDIRMPGMDGLELFKKIRQVNKITKVIIISGYSDFEYLKAAIQLGASDYELKPIKVRSLINLIKRVSEDILKEKVSAGKFKLHLEAYKESFINNLITGKITDPNIIADGIHQYLGLDEKGTLLCISMEIDNYIKFSNNGANEKAEEIYNFISEFCNIHLFNTLKGLFHRMGEKNFIIVIKTDKSTLFNNKIINDLKIFLIQLNECLQSHFNLTVSAGISKIGSLSGVSELYNQSKEALKFKFYSGEKSVNLYSDFSGQEKSPNNPIMNKDVLKNKIDEFDFNSIEDIIEEYFIKIRDNHNYSVNKIESLCRDLISIFKETVKESNCDFEEVINTEISELEDSTMLITLENYKDYVLKAYGNIIQEYSNMKSMRFNLIVVRAVKYIKKNYNKDLTVETLSEYVGKTSNYFSHLFKKELGVTFSEYLNRIRIDKAKELICNSDLLIYEIAEKVGYSDYVYFTQVFKKYEGCPPTNLRKGIH